MILACNNIKKAFLDKDILKNVSFNINENEKVAIVGDNGCGKSTLLKIIVGLMKSDSGEVKSAKNTNIGYLAQHQDIDSNNTLYEEILSSREDILKIEADLEATNAKMELSTGVELDKLVAKYTSLTQEYERKNGYSYKSEVLGILNGLGFLESDYTKTINQFSGGQKTRIALGKILLTAPEILILDEPTNHLDINSINWLENYLLNYKGTVIIVSHDRYFLDKLVTKVIHIELCKATTYLGNYTDFNEKYTKQREIDLRHYENQQKEIKHQQEVIDKLKSFNREKSIKRAESRQKALDKIERLDKPIEVNNQMRLTFKLKIESGNDVLHVENLEKSFGYLHLFKNISFDIKKGEKVALIGDNGTGKTTILKILNRFLPADNGMFKLGTNVTIGYYDQEQQLLNPTNTLFDEISDLRPELSNTQIRNILAAYLFTEDDVFKQVSSLSGGEKGRLSLARLMLSNANFLILDEPTNHLDILSKSILEKALNSYEGTVLYVSHDRYFINTTATRILSLNNNQIYNYIGNYDYYLDKKTIVEGTNTPSLLNGKKTSNSVLSTPVESESKSDWKAAKEAQAAERKRQNAINKIENEISSIETRISELDEQMSNPDIASDISKLMPLSKEKEELDEKLLELMEKWEDLN